MEESLTLLYTANIGGELSLLPRLHTFLRHLKSLPVDEPEDVMLCAVEPVTTPLLLLDLGNACAPDVWHCEATGGRSALIVLDAMGYQSANVSGFLGAESRAKLAANLMSMALIDDENPWQNNDILFTSADGKHKASLRGLHIILAPAQETRLVNRRLEMASVNSGQVGLIRLRGIHNGTISLLSHHVFDLPPDTPPDPTIAAAVDFVLDEARFFRRRNS